MTRKRLITDRESLSNQTGFFRDCAHSVAGVSVAGGSVSSDSGASFGTMMPLIWEYTTPKTADVAFCMPPNKPITTATNPAKDEADMYVYVHDVTLQATKYLS